MKHLFLGAILALTSIAQLSAQKAPNIDKVPTNMEEFVELRNKIATTPEGGAAVYVVALLMYAQDTELGVQAVIVASDQSRLVEASEGSANSYKGYKLTPGYFQSLRDYFGKHKDHLANTYILGTSTKDWYKLPAPPYKMELTRNKYSEQTNGDIKVYVKCSGASSPRPISLRKNDKGIWKATEASSLFVGVAKPAKEDKL